MKGTKNFMRLFFGKRRASPESSFGERHVIGTGCRLHTEVRGFAFPRSSRSRRDVRGPVALFVRGSSSLIMSHLAKFEDLLARELKELYHGERQQLVALPKLARSATHPPLRSALDRHAEQTSSQLSRIEQAAARLKLSPRGKRCPAIKTLILEATAALGGSGEAGVKDAGLIVIVQKIEHYEICGYGSARTLAQVLGHDEVAALLQTSLEEEIAADRQLTDIAVDLYTETDLEPLKRPCIVDLAFQP
jgi:ferritin-like metal-binding protein YciE